MFLPSLVLSLPLADATGPPVWPSQFHVNFAETTHGLHPWGKDDTNQGELHYDFVNKRQLYIHGEGQTDNWCECANTGTNDECHLLTSMGANGNSTVGSMVAYFPKLSKCCTIGGWDHGFGPNTPEWLVSGNSTHVGTKVVNGRTCDEWANPHPGDTFMMTSDNWSQDAQGVPCDYVDTFKKWVQEVGMHHYLTFDAASYSTASESDTVFAAPSIDCSQTCPNKKGWCKA